MKRTTKPKILVVDDDNSVRESLRKLLEAERYDVLTARDSAEALEHFESNAIDLVVLDINLGAVDGWETFRRMTVTNAFVPTVVISGEFGQRERAVTAGVEALIEKPMDVPTFLEIIRKLLAETREERLKRVCEARDFRYVGRSNEAFRRDLERRCSTPLNMPWFERLRLVTTTEEN
jgi:two-component system response regulator MprA